MWQTGNSDTTILSARLILFSLVRTDYVQDKLMDLQPVTNLTYFAKSSWKLRRYWRTENIYCNTEVCTQTAG